MKSLLRLAPLYLVTLSLALASCATPANRRALYFSTKPHGPWTDYERRREAEAKTGVIGGPSSEPIGPATPLPKTAPVIAPPPAAPPVDPVAPPAVAPDPAAVTPSPDASVAPAIVPTQ